MDYCASKWTQKSVLSVYDIIFNITVGFGAVIMVCNQLNYFVTVGVASKGQAEQNWGKRKAGGEESSTTLEERRKRGDLIEVADKICQDLLVPVAQSVVLDSV